MANDPGKDALRRALKRAVAGGGTPLGGANQTITANRTVDDGNNGYTFFIDLEDGTGQKAQALFNPNVPSIVIQANDGAGNISGYTCGSANINLNFVGTTDLRISGSAGTSGHVMTTKGTGNHPVWQTPEYMVPIWAEENSALSTGAYEWAYGNGASTPTGQGIAVHVPTGWSSEIVAMGLTIPNGTVTVEAEISGVLQGTTADVTVTSPALTNVQTMSSPPAVVDGDVLNFRTTAASASLGGPCHATMWLRYYIA